MGHFHPLVPAARALRTAGHDVWFATAPSFHPRVEASGFSVFAAGFDRERDSSDDRYRRLQAELESLPPDGPARTLFRIHRLFGGLYAERMIRTCWRSWLGGGLICSCVRSPSSGHASPRRWSASRTRRCGATRCCLPTPLATWSQRTWRVCVRFTSCPRTLTTRCCSAFCTSPSSRRASAIRIRRLRRPLIFCGPVPFSSSGDEAVPEWIEDLSGRPVVYATLGTVFDSRTPGLFEAIIDGLRDEPVELILTVGRDRDPTGLVTSRATSTSSATSHRACSCRTAIL
jgi:hypothetical protein